LTVSLCSTPRVEKLDMQIASCTMFDGEQEEVDVGS